MAGKWTTMATTTTKNSITRWNRVLMAFALCWWIFCLCVVILFTYALVLVCVWLHGEVM